MPKSYLEKFFPWYESQKWFLSKYCSAYKVGRKAPISAEKTSFASHWIARPPKFRFHIVRAPLGDLQETIFMA